MSGHVVLLGDSIFDNASYVSGGMSVIDHLRRRLPNGGKASLRAVDGACVTNVYRQLEQMPADATHLVLSIGGNDALFASGDLFTEDPQPMAQSLERVAHVVEQFAQEHRELLIHLKQWEKPLVVCTIYDHIPSLSKGERVGLSVFNDAITRNIFRLGATMIDLRLVCDDARDYAEISPIEPSAQGGEKIARAIADAILQIGSPRRVIV
ncbi:SGNH/GDSL hydrolase family protein [Blastopirellula marina]|uniref:Lipase n=1 Tax=Blastopirellula marina TaxID=124 RepID=A0A2S8G915_9BACT|nr:SGNH/GDSL hydrolase family protein [Blastopirellula marina]PQO40956.1 lipase [Blastopirellula marina]PTL45839.1 SGNH/GDSL hydrolase family protein [Blastopirellula marina]